jgi:type IV secretion system protein TrbC
MFSSRFICVLPIIIFALAPEMALAGSGTGLGWEQPLTQLRTSLTGPVAFTLSIIGIFGAGAGLIFGGEMNGFLRTLVILVMVIALVVAANNFLTTLFGASGAVV